MDKLTLTLMASGSVALDTRFKFVPLDIGGHILCPLEWTADKRVTLWSRSSRTGFPPDPRQALEIYDNWSPLKAPENPQ
jgi:hypothetical protein